MLRSLSFAVAASVLALAGCTVDGRTGEYLVYESCFSTSECEPLADACFELRITYPEYEAENAICSLRCRDDFDCPRGITGERGACYSVQGGSEICYERCIDDRDCLDGFLCVDTVGGARFDSICLPG